MPRAITARAGWPSGEWAPRLLGRFDLDQYARALQRCENFIVTPEGALVRRPPTRRLGETQVVGPVRLVPFPAPGASLVVEMGHTYFRVWDQDGPVTGSLSSPFTEAMLPDIDYAQDADVLVLVHPDIAPHTLRRTGATTFDIIPLAWLNGRAPLGSLNLNADNVATMTGTWPNITVDMSQNTFIAADVGRVFFLRDLANARAAYVTITTVNSPTQAVGTGAFQISTTLPDAGTEWALGLFSADQGCRAVTFHEARLWFGGFKSAPDTITGSVSASFNNFESVSPDPDTSPASNADKAIVRRVGEGDVLWLLSAADVLTVGTTLTEGVVRAGVTGVLTPTEAAYRATTSRGSALVRPLRVDSAAYFVERGRTRLRQLRYALQDDGFVTTDASLLCSHMLERGIRRLAYQQSPWSCIWMLDRDDDLFGITVETDQQVLGAHRHRLGGGWRGRAPRVIDIAVAPAIGAQGPGLDLLYLVTRRTQNGVEIQEIEVLEAPLSPPEVEDPTEWQRHAVERRPYVDSYRALTPRTPITAAADNGTALVFTYSGDNHPTTGATVFIRGLVWRRGQEIVSLTAANREALVALAVDTSARTFQVASPAAPATPLRLEDLGAPNDAVFVPGVNPNPAELYPVVTSVTVPAAEPGDLFVVAADGRVESGPNLSSPSSLVVGGYAYPSQIVTMPLHLTRQEVPSDLGEPTAVNYVTLRLWASIGGEVGIDVGEDRQTILTSTTSDVMNAPPDPAYKDVRVVTGGEWGSDASIRVSTSGAYPMEILALTANLKVNPR